MKNKISVITATYNGANFIADCIESVKASITSPLAIDIEHIVFDDGSNDSTPLICNKYSSDIRFFRREKNLGTSTTLNEAISLAQGKYIFVLDHDDVILQRTLFHLLQSVSNNTNRWVYSDFVRVNESLKYLIGEDYFGWNFKSPAEMLEAIFSGMHFIQHNVMYERSLFNEVGGYNPEIDIFLDLDLFIRFLLINEMPIYLPITSHLHRFHEKNLSIGHDEEQHLSNIQTLKRMYKWG